MYRTFGWVGDYSSSTCTREIKGDNNQSIIYWKKKKKKKNNNNNTTDGRNEKGYCIDTTYRRYTSTVCSSNNKLAGVQLTQTPKRTS